MSAAVALALARRGYRVLLATTDPTPSIGSMIGRRLSSKPVPVTDKLWAMAVDVKEARRLWLERFGDEVYEVASTIAPGLDKSEFLEYVSGAPGIADEFILYLVYEEWRRGGYDYLVWDTPAAGGSLRLLMLEYEFYSHLNEAARFYLRLRGILDKLRSGLGRSVLEVVEDWRLLAEELIAFISSSDHKPFIILAPDTLSLDVAEDIVEVLGECGVRPRGLIANMVFTGRECRGCSIVEELADRCRRVLEEARKRLGGLELVCKIPYIEAPDPASRVEKMAHYIEATCLDVMLGA